MAVSTSCWVMMSSFTTATMRSTMPVSAAGAGSGANRPPTSAASRMIMKNRRCRSMAYS